MSFKTIMGIIRLILGLVENLQTVITQTVDVLQKDGMTPEERKEIEDALTSLQASNDAAFQRINTKLSTAAVTDAPMTADKGSAEG